MNRLYPSQTLWEFRQVDSEVIAVVITLVIMVAKVLPYLAPLEVS
jgi:hypothetical protein